MICISCRQVTDDDSTYCIHCGAGLSAPKQSYTNSSLEPFSNNKLWGLRDLYSKDVIHAPQYSSIKQCSSGEFIAVVSDKYGILDKNGNPITRFKYDYLVEKTIGCIAAERDGLWTFIDKKGEQLAPFVYGEVGSLSARLLFGRKDNMIFLYDENGQELFGEGYTSVEPFNDVFLRIASEDLVGLINIAGEIVVPIKYASIKPMCDGLLLINEDNKWGVLSEDANQILPTQYDSINNWNDQLLQLVIGDKTGLADHYGHIIVPVEYSQVSLTSTKCVEARIGETRQYYRMNGEILTNADTEVKFLLKRKNRRVAIITLLCGLLLISTVFIIDFYTNEIGCFYPTYKTLVGSDKADWWQCNVNSKDNIMAIERYMTNNPNGMYTSIAKSRLENAEWQAINEAESSVQGYRGFIKKFPQSKYVSTARSRIEDLIWTEALNTMNISSLSQYVLEYPNGYYKSKALDYIDWLRADQTSSFDSYKSYLIQHPNGINCRLAYRKIIPELQCTSCNVSGKCQVCQGTGYFGTYQDYVKDRCPRAGSVWHGKNCKKCGGDGWVNEHYETKNKVCYECKGTKNCKICEGSGYVQDEWFNKAYAAHINCKECNQNGYIEKRVRKAEVKCSFCSGTGRWMSRRCSQCKGTGISIPSHYETIRLICPSCNISNLRNHDL